MLEAPFGSVSETPDPRVATSSAPPLTEGPGVLLMFAGDVDASLSGRTALCHLGLVVTAQLQQILLLPESTRLLVIWVGLALGSACGPSVDLLDATELDLCIPSLA